MVNIGVLTVTHLMKLIHRDQGKEHLMNSMNASGLCRPETDLCLHVLFRNWFQGPLLYFCPSGPPLCVRVYSRCELRSKTEKVIVLTWKILQRSALLFLWWRNKARVLFKHELLLNTQLSEPLFKIALFLQTRDLWRLCAETCSWDLDSWRCSVNNSLSFLSNATLCGTPCITPGFWTEVLYLLRFKVWKLTPGHNILVLSALIIGFFEA